MKAKPNTSRPFIETLTGFKTAGRSIPRTMPQPSHPIRDRYYLSAAARAKRMGK